MIEINTIRTQYDRVLEGYKKRNLTDDVINELNKIIEWLDMSLTKDLITNLLTSKSNDSPV